MTFASGDTIKADIVIAADGNYRASAKVATANGLAGLKSKARQVLNGSRYKAPKGHGLAAYRTTVQTNQVRANPVTSWIAENADLNLWYFFRDP